MIKAIKLAECFEKFGDLFSPKIIGELNGQHVKVVRCEGDRVPWHTHDNEDELFLVIEGRLDILTRDQTVRLGPGEFCIVPRGVEHRVVPGGHVKLLLFEPAQIEHTGKVKSEITKDTFDRLT